MAVYAKLRGVLFLAIADFILLPDKKDWRSNHRLLDTKTYENDLQDFYTLDQASWSEKELNTYEKMIKTEMDNLAVKEQKIMDIEAKGDAKQKISIAKKMLAKNKPLDKIIDFTGLTEKEIEQLK